MFEIEKKKVFFVSSGGETKDFAKSTSEGYTVGKKCMITLEISLVFYQVTFGNVHQ